MNIFNLPDLGEGLPDAEIHEWYVQEGDYIEIDQPLAAMETAKAVVEVPAPESGVIAKLFGKPGDIIKTGDALVGFAASTNLKVDQGTVVGTLEESHENRADNFTVGAERLTSLRPKATPAVRLLAKKLQVDLHSISGSGEYGVITRQDVENAANKTQTLSTGYNELRGVRRAMYNTMIQSQREIMAVNIFDEADIHGWPATEDLTVRLILAIIAGCQQEPALNAWFDSKHCARQCHSAVHLGLAMDSADGLFVPVIHQAESYSTAELRHKINQYKEAIQARTIASEQLQGATITLSNFGKFAGRHATPVIVPPMVAILAAGRSHESPVIKQGMVEAHRMLPLSLSFDHRAVTGGEATRFLGAVIASLQQPNS